MHIPARPRRLTFAALTAAALSLLGASSAQSAGDRIADRLERVMEKPEFRHSIFGASVLDLDTGKVLYEKNPETFFMAASTTKLVTVASALLTLGPDHRFHTSVYRTGEVGKDGVLHGDLILVASGDPNLSGRLRPDGTLAFEDEDHSYGGPDSHGVAGDPLQVIRELAQQVAAHGIRRIGGRVVVDARLFPEGDHELGTGVALSPIVVNDNLVDVVIGPGSAVGEPARLTVSPSTAYVNLSNEATTGAADSAPTGDYGIDNALSDGSHSVTITGSVPLGAKPRMMAYPVPQPHRYAEMVFAEALQERGVVARPILPEDHVDWKAAAAFYTSENRVAEHISPPLSAEATVILKVSQNLHASMMPTLIGALTGDKDPSSGFKKMRDALTKEGLDVSGAMQGDGAGGRAHFTPRFMTTLLTKMAKEPFFPAYYAALPILGRDGTLAHIQTDSPGAGHVHAKTGTFSEEDSLNGGLTLDAKALAGYVETKSGRRLAFALFVNNAPMKAEPDAAQKLGGQALGAMASALYDAPR
jgi:PBP4 family serine-type D-alanyl-D-alanine carboxypeptidase